MPNCMMRGVRRSCCAPPDVTHVTILWCVGCSECAGMSHSLTPREFASRNVAVVRQLWNGVRDGDVESIHQARIATRRIRAALSALGHADAEQLDVTKQLGRALGRVRELDATEE